MLFREYALYSHSLSAPKGEAPGLRTQADKPSLLGSVFFLIYLNVSVWLYNYYFFTLNFILLNTERSICQWLIGYFDNNSFRL